MADVFEISQRRFLLPKNHFNHKDANITYAENDDLLTELSVAENNTSAQAAKAAHKKLRQIEFRTQAKDHPILWAGDEVSYYLKFLIFQVLDER